jgi:hypothetical protein
MTASEALGRQWAGTTLHHSVTPQVAHAVRQGRVTRLERLVGFHGSMARMATDQPYERGDLARGWQPVTTQIRPGAHVALRGEGEEPGDEDITAREAIWRREGHHDYDIHNPRAVSRLTPAPRFTGPDLAGRPESNKLKSWNENQFFHHTSEAAAHEIMGRLRQSKPGLLLSRSGDTGPGVYTSADPTAWSGMGGRRDHPGYEFALHLHQAHGMKSLGAGPGGSSMYDRDPPKRVEQMWRQHRSHENLRTGRGIDPNFWRQHGFDTLVTGGKETVVTHPRQVQVLRATDKATGQVTHFQDDAWRHYNASMKVEERHFSPRQERK